ncbi:glucose PTS transporter subunit IIA [Companilactobacillus farciminis]|uniref:glucose PTS transporter subunit IIA n=1 Tax=Companilactobacillus farciminis TaxID=1612 RepID=UPI0019158E56|nr:PTS glucose transporter subunit IIABC [Companilactobacillus farciminis]
MKNDISALNIVAPVTGTVIPIQEVSDEVFSKKLMGDGLGINPTEGKIVSPIKGEVVLVAQTKHAIGIKNENGVELLIHLGIDTVELNGKPFEINIKEGDQVEVGQYLGSMNLDMIKEAGKENTVIVAITNSANILKSIDFNLGHIEVNNDMAILNLTVHKKVKSKSSNYSELANNIIDNVGGKENINNVIHCITRLRFYLKDESKANDSTISNLDGVIDIAKSAGQYQVVIGPAVGDVFDEVVKILGIDSENNDVEKVDTSNMSTGEKIKNGINSFIGIITGSMAPIIGILSASGIIKGMMSLMVSFHWMSPTGNANLILTAMSDAVFYFLPILIGFNAAKRMGGNPTLCAVIGGVIAYPTIIAATGKNLNILSIGNFNFPYVSYTYSIFPMILAAWIATKMEKKLKQIIPSFLQALINPMIIILVVSAITLLATGPIITWAAFSLASGIQALLSINTAIFGAIIDGFYQVLVIFGLHWGIVPLFVNDFATIGHSYLFAIVSITMVGQGGAALAVAMKTKNKSLKSLGYAAAISAFCGVTEPAIYGINLRYKKTFICANIGSAVGGFIIGLLHVNMWSIAGSIIGLPSFINPKGIDGSFYGAVLATIAALAVAFILTYVWGFNDQMQASNKREKPVNPGKVVSKAV